jgi:hypothetical protein
MMRFLPVIVISVVIAMGPWSILATRWLPLPAVLGYRGHSLDAHSRPRNHNAFWGAHVTSCRNS